MLLNALKCQGYSFYCFYVIKEKTTEGGKITLPPRLVLNFGCSLQSFIVRSFGSTFKIYPVFYLCHKNKYF